ncbi:hypothetical protein DPMN_069939 [Dreissena polymorpha]|uniref:Uncharacterized protein n=1 Tax=Dreissena polymorpha TaxID=45954 RepID=A0A9D3Z544_DREPO|nr:hypothetical protein DPMN_069939 [Dreissena polymorpha]
MLCYHCHGKRLLEEKNARTVQTFPEDGVIQNLDRRMEVLGLKNDGKYAEVRCAFEDYRIITVQLGSFDND